MQPGPGWVWLKWKMTAWSSRPCLLSHLYKSKVSHHTKESCPPTGPDEGCRVAPVLAGGRCLAFAACLWALAALEGHTMNPLRDSGGYRTEDAPSLEQDPTACFWSLQKQVRARPRVLPRFPDQGQGAHKEMTSLGRVGVGGWQCLPKMRQSQL